MPTLCSEATKAHIVDDFKFSLFSIPQLTKLGYTVIFDDAVSVMKNDQFVLKGHFDKETNLFWIPLSPPSHEKQFVHNIVASEIPSMSKDDITNFYHRTLLCPRSPTLTAAIQRNAFPT